MCLRLQRDGLEPEIPSATGRTDATPCEMPIFWTAPLPGRPAGWPAFCFQFSARAIDRNPILVWYRLSSFCFGRMRGFNPCLSHLKNYFQGRRLRRRLPRLNRSPCLSRHRRPLPFARLRLRRRLAPLRRPFPCKSAMWSICRSTTFWRSCPRPLRLWYWGVPAEPFRSRFAAPSSNLPPALSGFDLPNCARPRFPAHSRVIRVKTKL
jgi:hypothetical protein